MLSPPQSSRALVFVIAVGLGLPVVGSAAIAQIAPEALWDHTPFHSLVEGVGGTIALLLAGLLVNRIKVRDLHTSDSWAAAALCTMGLFDLVHAAVMPGQSFVWLHSMATAWGGLFFGLMVFGRAPRRLPHAALAAAAVSVLLSVLLAEELPAMVDGTGAFTPMARALNMGGGLGFLLAAAVCQRDYRNRGSWDALLFSTHCALLASAALLFDTSRLWDGGWWWWHMLRLAAYGVAMAYVAFEANKNELQMAEQNAELDRRNEELEERVAEETKRRTELEEQRWMARLEHTQKLESLGVLAGGIAHDFNNLLVGVLGNAELALEGMPEGAPRQAVSRVAKAGRRASDLTRQMLAFSGKGGFVMELIELNREVQDMAELLAAGAGTGADLRMQLSSSTDLVVEGDRSQLQQVVMNFITNASDALDGKAGTITLRTGQLHADEEYLAGMDLGADRPPGDYVFLEVSDTGYGMSAATRTRMFDPFYTTKGQGRGLGLAATQGIVRGHEGALMARSEVGRGTTVKLLLPRAEAVAVEEVQPAATTGRGQGVILVVDDEVAVRDLLEAALPHFGYIPLLADGGAQALAIWRDRGDTIDGVILDLTMPGMSGKEVFAELRRLDPEVRVLLSSGFTEQDTTSRFVGKGLAGFLQKPYRLEDLGRCLELFKRD